VRFFFLRLNLVIKQELYSSLKVMIPQDARIEFFPVLKRI